MSTIATTLHDGTVRIDWYGKAGTVRAHCRSSGITVDLEAVPWTSHEEASGCLRDIEAVADVYWRYSKPTEKHNILRRLGPSASAYCRHACLFDRSLREDGLLATPAVLGRLGPKSLEDGEISEY